MGKIRDPIKARDQAIQEHDEMLQGKVDAIRMYTDPTLIDGDAAYIQSQLSKLKSTEIDDSYEDRKADATLAQVETVKKLEELLAARTKYESEQVELEKLRQEKVERDRKDREGEIRRESTRQATLKAEAKAKREQQDKDRIAQAQADEAQDKINAAERKQKEAEESKKRAVKEERERIEAEQRRQREATAQQERIDRNIRENKEHRDKIEKEVKESLREITLSGDWLGDPVEVMIEAFRERKIKHVSINY